MAAKSALLREWKKIPCYVVETKPLVLFYTHGLPVVSGLAIFSVPRGVIFVKLIVGIDAFRRCFLILECPVVFMNIRQVEGHKLVHGIFCIAIISSGTKRRAWRGQHWNRLGARVHERQEAPPPGAARLVHDHTVVVHHFVVAHF